MKHDKGSPLAIVVRELGMVGVSRAEVVYVDSSGVESNLVELSATSFSPLVDQIRAEIAEAASAGVSHAIFDLARKRFIDSTWLGNMISLYNEIHVKGGNVVLTNCNTTIANILEVTSLNKVFICTGSMEEAVVRLRSENGAGSI